MKTQNVILIGAAAVGGMILWPQVKEKLQNGGPNIGPPMPAGAGGSGSGRPDAGSGYSSQKVSSQPQPGRQLLQHSVDIAVRDRSGRPVRGTVTPVFESSSGGGGKLIATPTTFTKISKGFAKKMMEAGLIT